MMMGPWGWSGMWLGWLLMVGFTVAVILLIVWLVRLSVASRNENVDEGRVMQRGESALEILRARYARGEISKEEYLEMRATLSQ
ncbi:MULTISPECIES: SHOCT domain-containing protein [Caldilinea]|nr:MULTISPECIES: SHOCT domain-containing protein [Caldilinea]